MKKIRKRSSPSSHVTTRVSGRVGSRHDAVGGESAAFARSGGGTAFREHVSFPSLADLRPCPPARLPDVKSSLLAEMSSSSSPSSRGGNIDAAVMDRLHETAYQASPAGNSLGGPVLGTPGGVGSLTPDDVRGVAGRIRGSDVVVSGTGRGDHGRLVEGAEKAYGHLPKSPAAAGGGGTKAVVGAGEKSHFIGSDVR